jgi:phage shock protein PspC (stress-responsive transcriptional regulator)
MNIADEIQRLNELRSQGALTDDEFTRAKARLIAGDPPAPPGAATAINKLRRSRSDKWVGGVCGGLALSMGVEAWMLRLVITALALFGGTGVLLYLLLWIFVPQE